MQILLHRYFSTSSPFLFSSLCNSIAKASSTTLLKEKVNILNGIIHEANESGLDTVKNTVQLLSGKITNEKNEYVNFMISDNTMDQCMQNYFQIEPAKSKQLRSQCGGIPEVCQSLFQELAAHPIEKPYEVNEFHTDLVALSKETGEGSRTRLFNLICSIWNKCSNNQEMYYSTLLILRNRGIGFGDKLICKSLLQSFVPPTHQSACQQVFNYNPRFNPYISFLSSITPNTPLQQIPSLYPLVEGQFISCQLCSPLSSLSTAEACLQKQSYLVEKKYDGIRIQLHCIDHSFYAYGRSGERLGPLEHLLEKQLKENLTALPTHFIVDGEVVVVKENQIKPFHDVTLLLGKKDKQVEQDENVCLCVFDVLSLHQKTCVDLPLRQRKELLTKYFNLSTSQGMTVVPWKEGSCDLQEEMKKSLAAGCEGLILKKLESRYDPGGRTKDWLKLKADYLDGFGDSIDTVIIGGKFGKGQRQDVYGSFLCAVRSKETEKYRPICCVGSGFTESDLEALSSELHSNEINREKLQECVDLPKSLKMDAYFYPTKVVELKGSEITESKCYAGLSLRFPRFLRLRDDKRAEDVTLFENLKIGRKI